MSAERGGFRGYIASRPVRGTTFPQRIQNTVVRTYAARNDLAFKLSLTEYAMPGCYMMLETLLAELPKLDGVIIFSMFMLPRRASARQALYARLHANGSQLHAALEDVAIRHAAETARFEDTLRIAAALERAPLAGRFSKDGPAFAAGDAFASAVLHALGPA